MEKRKVRFLGVVGSRSFNDYPFLSIILSRYAPGVIVSGGARGADALASRYANEHSIPLIEIPAEWRKWGKRAGIIRNRLIVDRADEVVAFWDGSSRGTRSTIDFAREIGVPVQIICY